MLVSLASERSAKTHSFLAASFTVCTVGCGADERHVVVGEVLPQQQRFLVFFPRQTVTIIVDVKILPPGNK